MAIILRNSLLISSILSSSETWYGLTLAEIVRLEQVDEMLWLNILECSSSVPRNLIYLELGILRIRDIIKTRRFMFLHHILKQNESSLLYRFFIAQVKYPTYKDWTSQILEDMEELNIDLEFQDISDMSKERFKNIISEKIRNHAFNELLVKKLSRKSEHARGRNIKYEDLNIQEYLTETESVMSCEEKKWLFKCRTDDIDLKANFKWKYEQHCCISCKENIYETNEHLVLCQKLMGKNELVSYIPDYKDLFGNDIDEQIYISRILKENFRIRKHFLPS